MYLNGIFHRSHLAAAKCRVGNRRLPVADNVPGPMGIRADSSCDDVIAILPAIVDRDELVSIGGGWSVGLLDGLQNMHTGNRIVVVPLIEVVHQHHEAGWILSIVSVISVEITLDAGELGSIVVVLPIIGIIGPEYGSEAKRRQEFGVRIGFISERGSEVREVRSSVVVYPIVNN